MIIIIIIIIIRRPQPPGGRRRPTKKYHLFFEITFRYIKLPWNMLNYLENSFKSHCITCSRYYLAGRCRLAKTYRDTLKKYIDILKRHSISWGKSKRTAFVCAVAARIRRLRKSPQHLFVILRLISLCKSPPFSAKLRQKPCRKI